MRVVTVMAVVLVVLVVTMVLVVLVVTMWSMLVIISLRRLAAVTEATAAVVRMRITSSSLASSIIEAAAHSVRAAEVARSGLVATFTPAVLFELGHVQRHVLVVLVVLVMLVWVVLC